MSSWIGNPELGPLERPEFRVEFASYKGEWSPYFRNNWDIPNAKEFIESEHKKFPSLNRRIIHSKTKESVFFKRGIYLRRIDTPKGWREMEERAADANYDRLKKEHDRFLMLRKYPDWHKEAKFLPESIVWNTRIEAYVYLEGTASSFVNEESNLYYYWERDGEHDIDHEDTLCLHRPLFRPTKTGIIRRTLNFILG